MKNLIIDWTVCRIREGWRDSQFVQSKRLEKFLDKVAGK